MTTPIDPSGKNLAKNAFVVDGLLLFGCFVSTWSAFGWMLLAIVWDAARRREVRLGVVTSCAVGVAVFQIVLDIAHLIVRRRGIALTLVFLRLLVVLSSTYSLMLVDDVPVSFPTEETRMFAISFVAAGIVAVLIEFRRKDAKRIFDQYK